MKLPNFLLTITLFLNYVYLGGSMVILVKYPAAFLFSIPYVFLLVMGVIIILEEKKRRKEEWAKSG